MALELEVDLAVLDVAMPQLTGLQAAAELKRRRPELRTLMLSMYDSEQYFFEALKAGASGYVLKSAADRDLVEACRAAMRGEPFLYPAAVAALIRDYLDRASPRRGGADATRSRRASSRSSSSSPRATRATRSPRRSSSPRRPSSTTAATSSRSSGCATASTSRATRSGADWSSPEQWPPVPTIYVTGHRNPDTDSIASAMGYAELKRRLDPRHEYVPVRLGDVNAQTAWVLERAGAEEPEFLPHIMLRVRDVMRESFPSASQREPIRRVGRAMAREDLELMPIVDDDGALAGVMTERTLARRYIRESREPTSLSDAAASVEAIVEVTEGRLVAGEEREIAGRVWVLAMAVESLPGEIGEGDVVVVGDRPDAQRRAVELGVALLVTSNGTVPSDEVLALAREHGTTVVSSPLDSYVTSRMVTLSAPSRALMNAEPLTVRPDDLLADVAEEINAMDYRAAIAVDGRRRPVGLITHAELADPEPRRVLLVDHAEEAQSVPGVEQAEIVEILDHHHIGSIETKVPVTRDLRPGRLDRHARRRALPPERHGADVRRRRRCCSGRCCRTP